MILRNVIINWRYDYEVEIWPHDIGKFYYSLAI